MKKFLSIFLAGMMIFTIALSFSSIAKATQPQNDEHKVRICHRTNSVTNPYVSINVDIASVDGNSGNDNGQGDHLLEHTGPVFDINTVYPTPHNGNQWGDIIPPFDNSGQSYDNPQTSLNWPAGESIWDNNCNVPGLPTPSPSPSVSPSPSPSSTPTPSPSCSHKHTPTPSPSVSSSPSPTPSPSPSGEVTPTPTPSPMGGGVPGTPKIKISPQVLGTTAPTAEPLPVAGADVDYSWIYYFLTIAGLSLTYYMKEAGWKKLAK